ncbi:MAG TPA: MucR family transcriptional regulator [Rhizomicrobium sp.]|nr:MucR family transcriptional regulator [Rhizomicrobium sp.]
MQSDSESLLERSGEDASDYVLLAGRIVASYVSNNTVAPNALAGLIERTYATLEKLKDGGDAGRPRRPDLNASAAKGDTQKQNKFGPAVPIDKSVTPDHIICLEDGKRLKMLKRHLRTKYGLTLEDYRAKWRLPPDYPVVAPSYAAARSKIAKAKGLGKWSRTARRGRAQSKQGKAQR